MGLRIGIIGLGLMGGSLAYALRGFRDATIVGTNRHAEVCQAALASGAVDEATTDTAAAIRGSDLVIFCIYARQIPEILKQHQHDFKLGAVVADIYGAKCDLNSRILSVLPPDVDYIGIHPMAGKERDGFANADAAIFKDSGFVICPLPSTSPESVELMRELAAFVGATRVAVATPEKHDEIIAYTSDLTHIAAAALCLDYHPDMSSAYTAGAFRDCTRIADINAPVWAELLLDNSSNTVDYLDRYLCQLQKVRRCLVEGDEAGLCQLLEQAGENKREMLKR
ncbi:MAG: prephenate dehydrogenase [Actinomycetia bacterium]|nr:prephenate dehydrogenase [Actinomycetes bacterium]